MMHSSIKVKKNSAIKKNSGSKPELIKKVNDQQHHAPVNLDWFGQLETNPVTLNVFIMVQAPDLCVEQTNISLNYYN